MTTKPKAAKPSKAAKTTRPAKIDRRLSAPRETIAANVATALDRLERGETLTEIGESIGVQRKTLLEQLNAADASAYARARDLGLQARGEKIQAMASAPIERTMTGAVDSGAVAHRKLIVDTEKWLLSKLIPHVYGDKLAVQADVTMEIKQINMVIVPVKKP